MDIPVLVEPVAGNGFRAKTGEPFALTAEGATREEAVARLRERISKQLNGGATVVSLQVGAAGNPWLEMAGMFDKDDPLVQEWKQIMEENRRAADQDPDYL